MCENDKNGVKKEVLISIGCDNFLHDNRGLNLRSVNVYDDTL